jgi:hypothetical protein
LKHSDTYKECVGQFQVPSQFCLQFPVTAGTSKLNWSKLLERQYFNLSFSEEIISIFKNFCTTNPNFMEPSPCTSPPHEELSKNTKNMI